MLSKNPALKLIASLTIILLIIISNVKYPVQGSWQISDGTKVDYLLESANWTVYYGLDTATGEGCRYNDIKVKPNNEFEIKVNDVDDVWGIEYEINNSTDSSIGSISTALFLLEFEHFLYYPTEECIRLFSEGFNENEISLGPNMFGWFFIEPSEALWSYFNEIIDIEYHKSRSSIFDYQAYFESFFERREKQAIFDVNMYGDFINDTLEVDINFQHNIKFIWNDTTGILLGYRISTQFSGIFYGLSLSEELEIVCREVDYNLPNYKFYNYTGFIPGYDFGITVIAIFTISISILIFLKRKKR
ncbi:MAG: choice-of-anchor S family protein [Candidatus Thorarchaeota archaeon]